jgi:hypothetical protein
MKKKAKRFNKSTILSLLVTFTIYLGAVLIYFYANGWRIDPKQEEILIKTGSVYLESVPDTSSITIDDKSYGKTPRSVSLSVGDHNILVSSEGYYPWEKTVSILEEKLTSLSAWLLPIEKEESSIYSNINENVIQSWEDEENNRLIFLTKDNREENINQYTLWAYDINRVFWDLSDNPYKLFIFETDSLEEFKAILSHTGTSAVITIKDNDITSNYLITTARATDYTELDKIDINSLNDYTQEWSQDDKYLIFESDEELITYNIQAETKHLIFKKSEDRNYVWTTDSDGYFYQVQEQEDKDTTTYEYALIRKDLDGANTKTLISSLYFQKETSYLNEEREERELLDLCTCNSFTNSPESTKTVGEITGLDINNDTDGIYINTDEATYWYDLDNKKWLLVSPYQSELIGYSSNNDMFIYTNEHETSVFRFKKDSADYSSIIGARKIQELKDSINITWLENNYILAEKNNLQFTIDTEGDNQVTIVEDNSVMLRSTVTEALDKVIVFEKLTTEDTNLEIAEAGFSLKSLSLE